VFFGYDSSTLDASARRTLDANAEIMQGTNTLRIQIQGHADERGTTDYNLALGQSRAQRVFDYMVSKGIAPSRLAVVSFGEEQPLERGADDAAYTQNRRGEFRVLSGGAPHISGSVSR
jgi:peptidoglycan-associated lipoprotein